MSITTIQQLAPEVLATGARFGVVGVLAAGAAIGAAAVAIKADEKFGISDAVKTTVYDVIDTPHRVIMAQLATSRRHPTVSLVEDHEDEDGPYRGVADPMDDAGRKAKINTAIQAALQREIAERVFRDCAGTGVEMDHVLNGLLRYFDGNRNIPCGTLNSNKIDPATCQAIEQLGKGSSFLSLVRQVGLASLVREKGTYWLYPTAFADITIEQAIIARCQ